METVAQAALVIIAIAAFPVAVVVATAVLVLGFPLLVAGVVVMAGLSGEYPGSLITGFLIWVVFTVLIGWHYRRTARPAIDRLLLYVYPVILACSVIAALVTVDLVDLVFESSPTISGRLTKETVVFIVALIVAIPVLIFLGTVSYAAWSTVLYGARGLWRWFWAWFST